jgi:hypothetical protein
VRAGVGVVGRATHDRVASVRKRCTDARCDVPRMARATSRLVRHGRALPAVRDAATCGGRPALPTRRYHGALAIG